MGEFIKELENEKKKLIAELEDIRRQIMLIDKLIIKKTAEANSLETGEEVNKKNVDRIFNETLIIQLIKNTEGVGLRTSEVIAKARARNKKLNPSTIRTYLTRMRNKGIIYKRNDLRWVLRQKKDSQTLEDLA